MPKTAPFDAQSDRYDDWFVANEIAYKSELRAVEELLPVHSHGVEVGAGTGRFACPLGLELGVEPSAPMAGRARARGLQVVRGQAEYLPLASGGFDLVLMVVAVCFLDDLDRSFGEAFRALGVGGHIVVGFLDRETELCERYIRSKPDNPFYGIADLRSVREVSASLEQAGFCHAESVQTIFDQPEALLEIAPVRLGHGAGLFVVIRARKLPAAVT